jgi:hypothetical protein
MKSRSFTPEQADRTLPLVERVVGDVVRDYATLADRAEEYRDLRSEVRVPEEAADEVRPRIAALKAQMSDISRRIDGYVEELSEIGCELKDMRSGAVDFPSTLDDRPIRLCWKPGDSRVEHWHEVNEGAESRRPLPVPVPED